MCGLNTVTGGDPSPCFLWSGPRRYKIKVFYLGSVHTLRWHNPHTHIRDTTRLKNRIILQSSLLPGRIETPRPSVPDSRTTPGSPWTIPRVPLGPDPVKLKYPLLPVRPYLVLRLSHAYAVSPPVSFGSIRPLSFGDYWPSTRTSRPTLHDPVLNTFRTRTGTSCRSPICASSQTSSYVYWLTFACVIREQQQYCFV